MKENTNSLASSVSKEKTDAIIARIDTNSSYVEDIVSGLVEKYCGTLDDYMAKIDDVLANQQTPITNMQLDEFTLNLPSILYFTSEAQETLGIKEDVSKAIKTELYNRIREKAQGTIADKDTAGELATQAESIISIAYGRAYKKVKMRVEAAYEMLSSVKKVMTRRIAESELSRMDGR